MSHFFSVARNDRWKKMSHFFSVARNDRWRWDTPEKYEIDFSFMQEYGNPDNLADFQSLNLGFIKRR
ncbi:hypothetical protein QUF72_03035 [Desulfobacterales bacterium HSG2]|nr:hypothetical protein [Desulfobacterales bacterium HSG2]